MLTSVDQIQSNVEPANGLYESVIDIERWFHKEKPQISALLNHNTPIVIVGPEGSGRTSLIFQWMQFHEAKAEFFTNITLFDLNQRIEMQNDRLRTFFARWLELTHTKKTQISTDKCKIIMIIDGIDRFESEEVHHHHQSHSSTHHQPHTLTHKFEEESPDWFPECFPDSFRVILSCKRNSKAYNHFKNMKIPFTFIYMPEITDSTIQTIVNAHFDLSSSTISGQELQTMKEQAIDYISTNRQKFTNHLFIHTFLHVMFPVHLVMKAFKLEPPKLSDIDQCSTVEELFGQTLKHYETNKLLPRSKFRRIICILALSKTGLRREELKDCLEVKIEIIDLFLKLFQFALLEYKQQYRINNEIYKLTIERMYLQEELFKNEIHASIVTILSKTKHFNSNSRLIDEVTYNIYKQGNQWLRLKDILSNLEIFCQMYKPQDKYTLAMFWQKLEHHGFDPVYEYNKTIEAFVLNYFPTQSELFVILTQLGRFFKELGDLETKYTPEFRHPPLIISQELEKIKLQHELEHIGGMLTENKNSVTPTSEEERYNIENPLFMQVYREKQVALLKKENPLFPQLQLYYYKRWIWLQFPWFCMDINSSFSAYMSKAMGKSIHMHMSVALEMDLVLGSLKIIKEAKSRKQLSGKNQIYAVPVEFFVVQDYQHDKPKEETKYSSSDESMTSKRELMRSQISNRGLPFSRRNKAKSNIGTPRKGLINEIDYATVMQTPIMTARNTMTIERAQFLAKTYSQSRLTSAAALTHRSTQQGFFGQDGTQRKSQYVLAKNKWIDQDFELASLKNRIKPENAVRVVSNQVKSYERKEFETAVLSSREMINEVNRLAFEIQQKERLYQSLQNCILSLDSNNKESQAYEKRLTSIQDKLDMTKQQYRVARKEQNRLRYIVNYCFKNKADNHEWIQGLELAVSNMITMIKHEKESIIDSKNLILELKKESKELSKLKQERKMLQGKTTDAMYGMINEKQSIKTIREEFEKMKAAVMRGNTISNDQLEQSNYQSTAQGSPSRTGSPIKSPITSDGGYKIIYNKKSDQRQKSRQNDQGFSINQQSPPNKDQVNQMIQKLEQIRSSSGVKQIDDVQSMIDFLYNYKKLLKERDFKEERVTYLRTYKQELQRELDQFHNQDIDTSNQKYQPHKLQNNLMNDIIQAQLKKSQTYSVLKKSQDLLISTTTLIEEMRKKVKLSTQSFKEAPLTISGEVMALALKEVIDRVTNRQQVLENLFGTTNFQEVMQRIQDADPHSLRSQIIKLRSKSRQENLQKTDQMRSHETELQSPEIRKISSNLSQFSPNINLNHNYKSEQKLDEYNIHGPGILIDDIETLPSQISNDMLEVKKKEVNQKRKTLSKRVSKYGGDQINLKLLNRQSSVVKDMPQEDKLFNIYQIPKPILLDDSSVCPSVMSLTKNKKEVAFYRRADELEKEQDVVKVTLKQIDEFRRRNDTDHQVLDDSYAFIEEERKRLKTRGQDIVEPQPVKKKPMTRVVSQDKITKIDQKPLSSQKPQRPQQFDQDEEPINDVDDKPSDKSAKPSKVNMLDAYLNDEAAKLPAYAKNILTNNHKDLVKKLNELNQRVKNLDQEGLFKKLMAQTERHKRQKSHQI